MTRQQRLDDLIEDSIQRWRARLHTNYWLRHNRSEPIYEEPAFATLPPGTWIYSAPGAPWALKQPDGTLLLGRARYQVQPDRMCLVKIGTRPSTLCDCSPCTIYRTCFTERSVT